MTRVEECKDSTQSAANWTGSLSDRLAVRLRCALMEILRLSYEILQMRKIGQILKVLGLFYNAVMLLH